jgi:GTP 3',8-cyclase
MKCLVENGKIVTEACEVNAVHHCNLTCRGCSHLSPILPKKAADPAVVFESLSKLSRVAAPSRVQIVGGEPLLHPNLLGLVKAVRDSGLAPRIRLISNGTLLHLIDERLIKEVDELHLSIYPGKAPLDSEIKRVRGLTQTFNVELDEKCFDHFREPFATVGTKDANLIQKIYSTCKMAHTWHCHTIEGRFFYKCPQSVFMTATGIHRPEPSIPDRVLIDDRPGLLNELITFLESSAPLSQCSNCLGSVGRLYEHQQAERKTWLQSQTKSTEDLVDYVYLESLERENMEYDNLCVRQQWQDPANQPLVVKYPDSIKTDVTGS